MTIIALVDIHGSVAHLGRIEGEVKKADWILIGGDITHFGGAKEASEIISSIRRLNPHIFAVSGNCDKLDVEIFLKRESLGGHGGSARKEDYTVLGVSGSLPAPVFTPHTFSEKEYSAFFSGMGSFSDSGPDIVVSHQPPKDTLLDKVWGMRHVGSESLRNYIQQVKPRLVICGHIHESSGVDRIGETQLVNPGPFRNGNWARISLTKDELLIDLSSG